MTLLEIFLLCTIKQYSEKKNFFLLNTFIVTHIWGQAVLTGYNKLV